MSTVNGTYRTKPHLVMAVQATEDTTVTTFSGFPLHVSVGDWVVRDVEDAVQVLSDADFTARYEPIPDMRREACVAVTDAGFPVTTNGYRHIVLWTEDFPPPSTYAMRPATPDEILRGVWADEGARRR